MHPPRLRCRRLRGRPARRKTPGSSCRVNEYSRTTRAKSRRVLRAALRHDERVARLSLIRNRHECCWERLRPGPSETTHSFCLVGAHRVACAHFWCCARPFGASACGGADGETGSGVPTATAASAHGHKQEGERNEIEKRIAIAAPCGCDLIASGVGARRRSCRGKRPASPVRHCGSSRLLYVGCHED